MIVILLKMLGLWLFFAAALAAFAWTPHWINGWSISTADILGLVVCALWGASMSLLGIESIEGADHG